MDTEPPPTTPSQPAWQPPLIGTVVSLECDLCRQPIETGMAYYEFELRFDDQPTIAGESESRAYVVEESQRLDFCARCRPLASRLVDGFLQALFELRAPDPTPSAASSEPCPPTEPSRT